MFVILSEAKNLALGPNGDPFLPVGHNAMAHRFRLLLGNILAMIYRCSDMNR